jgi:hypothetical protein
MSRALGRGDVQAGLVFVLFGGLAIGLGPAERGTAAEMAAGYLPTLLGLLLITVGLILAAHGVRAVRVDHSGAAEQPPVVSGHLSRLRPFLILPAIVAFALLLESAGLVIASLALLVIGACAARDLTLRQFAVLAVLLLALVLVVFVWGLGLPVKVWP